MNSIYYFTRGVVNSGGEAVNESHVLALREMGLRAYLLYIEDQPIGHFASKAPVIRAGASMALSSGDIVVIPEPWKLHIDTFENINVKKIMHCQNPYYIFNGIEDISYLAKKNISAVITCSEYTSTVLRRMDYRGPLSTVQAPISSVFKNSSSKKLQIAYMPRKREFETSFVKGLFKSLYPELRSIPWIPIQNMSQADCARKLGESAVFASFSYIEGLGLPPLEAMASGCLVVGFNGLGGSDYSNNRNGFWIAEGDHFGFAHGLSEAIQAAKNPVWHAEIVRSSMLTVSSYSDVRFKGDLKSFWESYLGDDKNEFILGSS